MTAYPGVGPNDIFTVQRMGSEDGPYTFAALQDQVRVPVPGEAARRGLQQGALGLGAPVGLGPSSGPGASRGRRHVASHTDMRVCYLP